VLCALRYCPGKLLKTSVTLSMAGSIFENENSQERSRTDKHTITTGSV